MAEQAEQTQIWEDESAVWLEDDLLADDQSHELSASPVTEIDIDNISSWIYGFCEHLTDETVARSLLDGESTGEARGQDQIVRFLSDRLEQLVQSSKDSKYENPSLFAEELGDNLYRFYSNVALEQVFTGGEYFDLEIPSPGSEDDTTVVDSFLTNPYVARSEDNMSSPEFLPESGLEIPNKESSLEILEFFFQEFIWDDIAHIVLDDDVYSIVAFQAKVCEMLAHKTGIRISYDKRNQFLWYSCQEGEEIIAHLVTHAEALQAQILPKRKDLIQDPLGLLSEKLLADFADRFALEQKEMLESKIKDALDDIENLDEAEEALLDHATLTPEQEESIREKNKVLGFSLSLDEILDCLEESYEETIGEFDEALESNFDEVIETYDIENLFEGAFTYEQETFLLSARSKAEAAKEALQDQIRAQYKSLFEKEANRRLHQPLNEEELEMILSSLMLDGNLLDKLPMFKSKRRSSFLGFSFSRRIDNTGENSSELDATLVEVIQIVFGQVAGEYLSSDQGVIPEWTLEAQVESAKRLAVARNKQTETNQIETEFKKIVSLILASDIGTSKVIEFFTDLEAMTVLGDTDCEAFGQLIKYLEQFETKDHSLSHKDADKIRAYLVSLQNTDEEEEVLPAVVSRVSALMDSVPPSQFGTRLLPKELTEMLPAKAVALIAGALTDDDLKALNDIEKAKRTAAQNFTHEFQNRVYATLTRILRKELESKHIDQAFTDALLSDTVGMDRLCVVAGELLLARLTGEDESVKVLYEDVQDAYEKLDIEDELSLGWERPKDNK